MNRRKVSIDCLRGDRKIVVFLFTSVVVLLGFVLPDIARAIDPVAQEMLCRINNEREKRGRKALAYSANLSATARKYSADMAARGFFGHRCPDGTTPGDRALAGGYEWTNIGENLAAGPSGVATVMAMLLESPPHRQVLLETRFCEVGIGRVFDPNSKNQYYWTQLFGRRQGVAGCQQPKALAGSCKDLTGQEASSSSSSGGGCFISNAAAGFDWSGSHPDQISPAPFNLSAKERQKQP